jgi:hypothetical protein
LLVVCSKSLDNPWVCRIITALGQIDCSKPVAVLAFESPDLAKNLLWMWASQDNRAFAYFTVHHCSSALARVDVQTLGIACKHLHTSILVLFSINKHATTIVVRAESCRYSSSNGSQSLLIDAQLSCPGTGFTVIDEARESKTSASTRIEAKFSLATHLHTLLAGFKLTALTRVVTTSTETEISTSLVDVGGDFTVAFAVQSATVSYICSTGHDEQSTRSSPWFLENRLSSDGNNGVVWTEQAAQRPETVTDRFNRRTIALNPKHQSKYNTDTEERSIPE